MNEQQFREHVKRLSYAPSKWAAEFQHAVALLDAKDAEIERLRSRLSVCDGIAVREFTESIDQSK
jgi:hypothetical protein